MVQLRMHFHHSSVYYIFPTRFGTYPFFHWIRYLLLSLYIIGDFVFNYQFYYIPRTI